MNELTFEKSMNALHGCDAVTISLKGVGEESYSTREVAEAIYEELEKVANAPRKNPSLTIDELVQLDGESVWCLDGEGHQCWCLVNAEYDDCMDNGGGSWQFEHYGMAGDGVMGLQGMGWTAYRYKVED